ncbi:TlpA disulfide reductase family protein [Granulosicoccaceae sp. 1_MG-2023]|nr:TlpA disulfide reductase family protein [Granulosicoccaceae sp. 1_MG-2023]
MPMLKKLLVICVLSLAGALPSMAAPEVDLPLTDVAGEPSRLSSQFNGEDWLLVMVWSTDCSICRAEAPQIQALSERRDETGVRVIGLALDGPQQLQAIRDYEQELGIGFDNFTAEPTAIFSAYASATESTFRGTPTFLLYTPEGELVGNNPGPLSPGSVERFIEKFNKSRA